MTKDGIDPLLSEEENTAHTIEPPTEEEKASAITTKSFTHVLTMVCNPGCFKLE